MNTHISILEALLVSGISFLVWLYIETRFLNKSK
jgi:hypothetical protein